MKFAQCPGNYLEIVLAEVLGDLLVILRFGFNQFVNFDGEIRNCLCVIRATRRKIGLPVQVIIDLRVIRIGIRNALEALGLV